MVLLEPLPAIPSKLFHVPELMTDANPAIVQLWAVRSSTSRERMGQSNMSTWMHHHGRRATRDGRSYD